MIKCYIACANNKNSENSEKQNKHGSKLVWEVALKLDLEKSVENLVSHFFGDTF